MVLRWTFTFSIFVFYNVAAVPRVHELENDGLDLVVNTGVGSIRGMRAEDGDYTMFLGIPYAEVDKNNPFGPASPHPNFENIFDAYDDSAICPQIEEHNRTVVGSLDCLHLHIYVPNSASAQNLRPVLVWIHGGAFTTGYANKFVYGPNFLIRHDVILVILNYRVGPYGFMCLDTPEVPGNQGLKDQVLALNWIKNNIAAFGGDDTKITVAGNSAGGMSTDYHLHFGRRDLFHQAILQSGVTSVASSMTNSDPTAPLRLAEQLNFRPNDLPEALAYLATVDTDRIIEATNALGISFKPCVEKEFEDGYVTEYPVNVDVPGVNGIKILIGFNNDELYVGHISAADNVFENTDYVSNLINSNFNFEGENEHFTEMKDIVQHFYLADEENNAEQRRPVIDMASDFSFNHPTIRNVRKYLQFDVDTMYLYLFSYSGDRNFVKQRLNLTGGGATHADELGYLFDISYMEKPLDPNDQLIMDRMTSLWTNFVKYGNPTPEVTELVPLIWPPVTHDKWHYLELDTNLRVSSRPLHDRMAFLDLFYKKNEQYQIGIDREESPSSARNVVLGVSLPLLWAIILYIL